jgi:FlaA1/EpsC-like NDP-sugar epimerase
MSAVSRLTDAATTLSRPRKQAILLGLDLVAALTAAALAFALHPAPIGTPATSLVALAGLVPTAAAALGLHRIKLNTYERDGILRSAALALFTAIGARALGRLSGIPLPDSALTLFALLFLSIAVTARWALLHLYLLLLHRQHPRGPVILYGAGATGLQLAAALARSETTRPVAFLDDSPALQGMTLAGLHVYPPAALPKLLALHGAARVILAMPRLGPARQQAIARRLRPFAIDIQTVPSFDQILGSGGRIEALQPVSADHFLNRPAIAPARPTTRTGYTGRSILVTGAGGSIGSELCRQLLACHPARLILFESSEHALYTIDKDLRPLAGPVDLVPLLGSVTDGAALTGLFARHPVDIVFHAAAMKHVPLAEANPIPAIETNVFGTRLVAEAAASANVGRFVLISTDKAVRPGNVMGASKRLAELAVQDTGRRAGATGFAIVRFGNVLGSSGSVVPLFREQIARGGPVTLTHPEVTRYFMTLSEAAQLVLATGAIPLSPRDGADVFVLDMGKPVRIQDLARQMIAAAGLRPCDEMTPDGDIEIAVTGLRPGEKLHEELLLGRDLLPTPHPKILRAGESGLSEFTIAQTLRRLRAAIAMRDEALLREHLFASVEAEPALARRPRPDGHVAAVSTGLAALRH